MDVHHEYMTGLDIRTHLHNRIEHLTDAQIRKLYKLLIEVFPEKKKASPRKLGQMKGLIEFMAPDFDDPLEDFKDYMPE